MATENEIAVARKKSEPANSLLLQPQPTSPFPSPSSSFVPPPAQEAHEFANKTTVRMAAAKQPRSASHSRRNSNTDDRCSSPLPTESQLQPDQALPPPTPTLKRFSADSANSSLNSSRPAPASPALSRHSSLLHKSSKQRLSTLSIVSTSTPPPAAVPTRRPILIKIRDFAYSPSDERHIGKWPHPNRDSIASSNGSGIFTRRRLEEDESSSDYHEANSQGDYSDSEEPEEDEDEAPFVPGIYRALYAFEPEGTAEMALTEDQHVRVLGRGGGVGWVVVLKSDGNEQALVPEGYLELVKPDMDLDGEADEDDEEESLSATEAPQTPRALS